VAPAERSGRPPSTWTSDRRATRATDRGASSASPSNPTVGRPCRCGGDRWPSTACCSWASTGSTLGMSWVRFSIPATNSSMNASACPGRRAAPCRSQTTAPLVQLPEGTGDGGRQPPVGLSAAAGSSLPVTWRLPDLELPWSCGSGRPDGRVGGSDDMDYHALEAMQCHGGAAPGRGDRGAGGEMVEGEAVWKAGEEGQWSKELLGSRPALSQATRPSALTEVDGRTQDLLGSGELQKLVRQPSAYFIEYIDGLTATLLNAERRDPRLQLRRPAQGGDGPGGHPVYLTPGPTSTTPPAWSPRSTRCSRPAKRPFPSNAAHCLRHPGELPDLAPAGPAAAQHTASNVQYRAPAESHPRAYVEADCDCCTVSTRARYASSRSRNRASHAGCAGHAI